MILARVGVIDGERKIAILVLLLHLSTVPDVRAPM